MTGEGGGGYLDKFCHFRPEGFDCLPYKIVSYELFRCGKMISEAVRIFYVLIIKQMDFCRRRLTKEMRRPPGNVVIYLKNGFLPPEANQEMRRPPGNVFI